MYKNFYILAVSFFLISCASGGGDSSNKPSSNVINKSTLNTTSVKTSFYIADATKIGAIKNTLKGSDVSAIYDGLKSLKITDTTVTKYRTATSTLKAKESTLMRANTSLQSATDNKNRIAGIRDNALSEKDAAQAKLNSDANLLMGFAVSKNIDKNGTTAFLDAAILTNDYQKIISALNEMGITSDPRIIDYNNSKVVLSEKEKSLNTAQSSLDKVTASFNTAQKNYNDALTAKNDAQSALTQAEQALKQFANNLPESKIDDAASSNSLFQKQINSGDISITDKSGKALKYTYTDGKLISIGADRFDKSKTVTFLDSDFKKNAIREVVGNKVIKSEIKYKENAGNIVFEFESGYSTAPGEENKISFAENYTLVLAGNSVNLTYSDFGYLIKKGYATDDTGKIIKDIYENKTFVGGYNEKKLNMASVVVDSDKEYSGRIVGTVSKNSNTETVSGDIKLTLKTDKSENIKVDFKDYYTMQFKSNATANTVSDMAITGTPSEKYQDYNLTTGGTGTFSKDYYGDSPNQAGIETTGRFNYNQGGVSIDTVFGAKKK